MASISRSCQQAQQLGLTAAAVCGASRAHLGSAAKQVRWAPETIDNEHLNKRSLKSSCYPRPADLDSFLSEEESSADEESSSPRYIPYAAWQSGLAQSEQPCKRIAV